MPQLSVQISEALQKSLERKAKDMGGFSISDAVRILLQNALEQPDAKADRKLHKQLLHYSISSYYMVQALLLNEFEEGQALNDEAHEKANGVLEKLLKKTL
jgi:Arc/MetJ-type ribon-helix-helix transcriptional regulator